MGLGRLLVACFVMAAAGVCAGQATWKLDPESPWPRWAHDNQGTGRGVKSQPSPQGKLEGEELWKLDDFDVPARP